MHLGRCLPTQHPPLTIVTIIANEDIFANPEKHEHEITEMKIEAALITGNSPYAEIRAVVPKVDDPNMPCSTIRAWFLGFILCGCVAFINGFFEIRQPAIFVYGTVPQLISYPLGNFCASVLPDIGFTLWGVRHSLNPGPFNRKEHMLVTVMSTVANTAPYTNGVVWIQALPGYFGQSWAKNFGYQICIALSANFIGYGMAGMCRRFLVHPSYLIWPTTLATIALNNAFHTTSDEPVKGPFGRIWHMSRIKLFMITFIAMFFYFFIPNYLFTGLSLFSWMAWIAPDNAALATITGSTTGLGLNPISTFDWNVMTVFTQPLLYPLFSTLNYFLGALFSMIVIVGLYYTNTYYTGHIPINMNLPYDRYGKAFNVRAIVDERGIFDLKKYQEYSPAYLSAAVVAVYLFFFALYAATLTYAALYHWREIALGFKGLMRDMPWNKKKDKDDTEELTMDIHNRLMKQYKEVPEWWYLICLVASAVIGIVAISHWPTSASPAVVVAGLIMCAIFIIPIGIIYGMTGQQVSLNVLAEFIGGVIFEGNAIGMSFFKTYGYVVCLQALTFTSDLKIGHYSKIPPRVMFWAQMVPTVVSTFVCVGIMVYQLDIENVCTKDGPFRFTCPNENTFFTAAVLWGTIGPRKLWGPGGMYTATLAGFPFGCALVLAFWYLSKKFPNNNILRNIHPVIILTGGISWAPYNLSFIWPAVPIAMASFMYVKKRCLAFWSKVRVVRYHLY